MMIYGYVWSRWSGQSWDTKGLARSLLKLSQPFQACGVWTGGTGRWDRTSLVEWWSLCTKSTGRPATRTVTNHFESDRWQRVQLVQFFDSTDQTVFVNRVTWESLGNTLALRNQSSFKRPTRPSRFQMQSWHKCLASARSNDPRGCCDLKWADALEILRATRKHHVEWIGISWSPSWSTQLVVYSGQEWLSG